MECVDECWVFENNLNQWTSGAKGFFQEKVLYSLLSKMQYFTLHEGHII